MTDRRFRVSARSDDLGETLYNIRRMIAEDDALAAARDRLQLLRDQVEHEDSAEFLARRHGGNAALARQLAGAEIASDLMASSTAADALPVEAWPLGSLANAPDAPRPAVVRPEPARNDLPRRLGSLFDELTDDFPEEQPEVIATAPDFETVLATTPEPLPAPAAVADDATDDLVGAEEEAQIRDLLSQLVREQVSADLEPALQAYLDPDRLAGIGAAMLGDLRHDTTEALDRMERALADMQAGLDARLGAALSDDLMARLEADLARHSQMLREEFGERFVAAADLVRATGVLGADLADRTGALRDDLVLAAQGLRAEIAAEAAILRQEAEARAAQDDARFDATAAGLRADLLAALPAMTQAEIEATLPDRIAAELQRGLRDVVLGDLRETVQTEIETDLPERIRQEMGRTLPQLRAEMDESLKATCESAVSERMGALVEGSLREQVRDSVRHELEDDLAELMRQQLQGSLREAIEGGIRAELSDMIRGELLGELGERFSRNLRIVIRREVAAALDAQMHRI
ncbi:hypothetical protein [Paracoccus sp. NSM]|uniref:hypothetical protein n=1 Tax=Paracoccus sp. NSM TaxID=3457784 RepID=UPI004036463C